jgi:hypothetical protein
MARHRARKTVFLAVLDPYGNVPAVSRVMREDLTVPAADAAALRVRLGRKTVVFAVNYADNALRGDNWQCRGRAAVIELP